jgi:hypothetical protein
MHLGSTIKTPSLPGYIVFYEWLCDHYPQEYRWDVKRQQYRHYKEGVFEVMDEEAFNKIIYEWAGDENVDKLIAPIHKYCKAQLMVDYTAWDASPLLCWENGMVDLEQHILVDWSPKYLCTYKFHAKFLTNLIETPYIDKIRNTYPDAFFALERFLQAIFHYDLGNEMMFCISGPSNAGKGTILNPIFTMLKEVSVAMSLWQLGDEKHAYTGVINKRCLIDKDSRFGNLNKFALETLLKMTGDDTRDGQWVNLKYARQFETEIKCFLLIATNQFAQLPINTGLDAFFRRVWIVEFDKKQKADPEFKEKVKSDIDAWATELVLIPYHRWKTPAWNKDEWVDKMSEMWDKGANPYKRFVREMFEHTDTTNDQLEQEDVMDWMRMRLTEEKFTIPNDMYLTQLTTTEMAGIKVRKRTTKNRKYYYPVKVRSMWEDRCQKGPTDQDEYIVTQKTLDGGH